MLLYVSLKIKLHLTFINLLKGFTLYQLRANHVLADTAVNEGKSLLLSYNIDYI